MVDPIEGAAPPGRRQAVWPWLLVPLVTLAMFFVLSRVRQTAEPAPAAPPPAAAPESAPSD